MDRKDIRPGKGPEFESHCYFFFLWNGKGIINKVTKMVQIKHRTPERLEDIVL